MENAIESMRGSRFNAYGTLEERAATERVEGAVAGVEVTLWREDVRSERKGWGAEGGGRRWNGAETMAESTVYK